MALVTGWDGNVYDDGRTDTSQSDSSSSSSSSNGLYADGLIQWGGGAGQPVYFKQPDGSWKNVGAPEHGESASYVSRAVSDPQIAKVLALYDANPSFLNNEQQAFIAGGMGSLDSFGQGYRWGNQNLFDNKFDPQQAGYLLQTGFNKYLSPADISSGQQFNQEQSPAAQAARNGDGGLFGGLGPLLAIAGLATGIGGLGGLGELGSLFGGAAEGLSAADAAAAMGSGIDALGWGNGALDVLGAGAAETGAGTMDLGSVADWYGPLSGGTPETIPWSGDLNSAIEAVANPAANYTPEMQQQIMQALNNAATDGGWQQFLDTGALGDPSTTTSWLQDLLSNASNIKSTASNVKSLASLFGLGNNPLATGGLGALQVLSSILGRNAANASSQGLQSSNRSPYYSAPLSPVSFAGPGRGKPLGQVMRYARGGLTQANEFGQGNEAGWGDEANLGYARGGTAGQDDKVPAMLSHGEYVFDADTVAALGDGNNEAGAGALDRMRENIRRHKRSAPVSKIPPKAKAPEQYLKGAK